jgi:uncharacterized protein (DUF302 family)
MKREDEKMETISTETVAYRIESEKPMETVVGDIEKAAADHGFRVLHTHDVQETLANKGLKRGPLKIMELCNASFAHEALQKADLVAIFMPCRISVHEAEGKTVMTLGRPSMIAQMLPGVGLEEMATEVETTLKEIMHRAQ